MSLKPNVQQYYGTIAKLITMWWNKKLRFYNSNRTSRLLYNRKMMPCLQKISVATLLWAKCGGEAQHSQSWEFGVLRDSRMFRVRQQGPKHLALECSWCHWKGLEAEISKMALH